jgi:hypothetical protein
VFPDLTNMNGGLAMMPTDGIKDPQVRAYLERLTQAWDELNDGQDRYVSRREFGQLAGEAILDVIGGGNGADTGDPGGSLLATAVSNLQQAIQNSLLYQLLGEGISLDSLDDLRSKIDLAVQYAGSGMSTEITIRHSQDMAIASAINRIWAYVGGATAVIDDGVLAAATPTSAVADKWNTVIAAVTDPNTGNVSSAAILTETRAYASNADSTFNAIYTVRAQIATDGTTRTATAATPAPGVNKSGATTLVLAALPSGAITVGMKALGIGIPGGTTVLSYTYPNVGLSAPLNHDADTTASGYTFTTASIVVGGFGLAASTGAGSSQPPTIDFGIRADKFWIAATTSTPSLATQLGAGYDSVPFIVVTSVQTIGGITYSPGVYMKSAFIVDASIDNAKIGAYIASNNFNGTINGSGVITANGTTGWAIDKSGNAVFNNVKVRGDIEATSLNGTNIVDGININGGAVSSQYLAITANTTDTTVSLSVTVPSGAVGLVCHVSPGLEWSGGGKDSGSWSVCAGKLTVTAPGGAATDYHGTSYAFISPASGTWTIVADRTLTGTGTSTSMYLVVTLLKK